MKKGFTFGEIFILIVIIIIVLAVVVVALNPGKILAKSRDSRRYADVTTLATAVNLYLADGKVFDGTALIGGQEYKSTAQDKAAAGENNGTGWAKIDLTKISSGTPLAKLPIDPINNDTYFYAIGFNVKENTYEINCAFEDKDNVPKQSIDGGNNTGRYEVGTNLEILA